jgi:DNA ligase-1
MNLSRRRLLAGLGAGALGAPCRIVEAAPPRATLAGTAPAGIDPRGWLVSEKLDGVRALWDGRALHFRSGREVCAPRSFTAALPPRPLDGELWLGRGRFEALSGLVRRASPDEAGWRDVRYEVFDLPQSPGPFAARAAALARIVGDAGLPHLRAVAQSKTDDARALQRRLAQVVHAGGEGLMLHRADALWAPGRSDALLKLKPFEDAEATVVAHEAGQGRHAGRLGALQVRTDDGLQFRLGTGFSDAQRADPPPVGSRVTFRFHGRTESGVPRSASFLRVRGVE